MTVSRILHAIILMLLLVTGRETMAQTYNRAPFNSEIVESSISEFEYWEEIQTKEVDDAFEAYLTGSYIKTEEHKGEIAAIFEWIQKGGVLGVATEAHEKWEVFEYLKKGFSLEEIADGTAYRAHKPEAHAVARYKELKLYQFLYATAFNDKPPAMRACLFVHPALKRFLIDVYSMEVTPALMEYFLKELKNHEAEVRTEETSETDIEKCMKLFETSYDYGDQRELFLRRGLSFFENIQ